MINYLLNHKRLVMVFVNISRKIPSIRFYLISSHMVNQSKQISMSLSLQAGVWPILKSTFLWWFIVEVLVIPFFIFFFFLFLRFRNIITIYICPQFIPLRFETAQILCTREGKNRPKICGGVFVIPKAINKPIFVE